MKNFIAILLICVACNKSGKVGNEDAQITALQAQLAQQMQQQANSTQEIAALQLLVADLTSHMADLASTVQTLGLDDANLSNQLQLMQVVLNTYQAQLQNLEQAQTEVQANVNSLLVSVATLQGYTNITGLIDPCGDALGKVDEILLKLSTGQILASFSDNSAGQNTRFAVIGPGNYSTTDGTNCHFTVDSNGNIL